jgi:hypothetical protein
MHSCRVDDTVILHLGRTGDHAEKCTTAATMLLRLTELSRVS